jgi:hypothetical protein
LLRWTPASAGVTKVRFSFLWVGYKPMATRNDSLEGFSRSLLVILG